MDLIFDDWKEKILERLKDIRKKDERFHNRNMSIHENFISHPIYNTINEIVPCVALVDNDS